MRARSPRRVALPLLVVALASACGSASSDVASVGGTVSGVGELPSEVAVDGTSVSSRPPSATTTSMRRSDGVIGAMVDGNRVLMIGDSIMASTSRRYSNDMCKALVPLGWQVEVDAESGRFIEFGDKVLDERLDAGWDVVVIGLGSNYDSDQQGYFIDLATLVDRVAPRPVVLINVTEFREDRVEVNDAIRFLDEQVDNVYVIDWAARTSGGDAERLLGGDGLHLSNLGRTVLAEEVAAVLGAAPVATGKCLASEFEDDSAGPVTGSSGGSTTTVRRGTTTTTRPPTSSTPATTSPGTTVPPATDPPATDPPTTGG